MTCHRCKASQTMSAVVNRWGHGGVDRQWAMNSDGLIQQWEEATAIGAQVARWHEPTVHQRCSK